MRAKRIAPWTAIVACTAAALCFPTTATLHAQNVEEFYRGKTVNIVIGYTVGGGYDIYGRLLARHIGKHIPGRPTVVPQNMPGAGSLKSLEYLLNVAPKDGLVLGTFGRSLPLSPLLEGAKYDATRLEWVGSIASDTSMCVAWHTTGIKSLEDLRTKNFTAGGLAKGSDPDIFSAVLRNLLGMKVRTVTGYPGTKDIALAIERGELDGICGYSISTIRTSHKSWTDAGKLVFLAQIALVKDKDLAQVPLLSDFGANDRQREALSLISLSQSVARPFAMPPGTVKERADAIRSAFNAAMKDPELLAEARTASLEITPYSGEQIADLLRKAYAMPKDVIDEAARAIGN